MAADLGTGEILVEKNKDKVFPIASISKIMTALVTVESKDLEQISTVSKRVLNPNLGQRGGLRLNEKFKTATLLYPLLLVSSNNASEVLSERNDRVKFMKAMNDKAKDIGLQKTSFEDPSGLSPKNISTPTELFKLAQYVKINHPEIFEITKVPKYSFGTHTWFSSSQFLGVEEYEGGKTGYTDPAMLTMLSIFKVKFQGGISRNIGIIVLRSSDRKTDVLKILNYVKNNFDYGPLKDADIIKDISTVNTPPPETEQVKIGFVGDIMMDRGVKRSVDENMDGDFSQLFKNMTSLKDKDTEIQFANLSGPASDKGEDNMNLYSFRTSPEAIPILQSSGFDVLSVAGSHIGDWGKIAFDDTLSRLKENEIGYTGGGANRNEAETPFIVEKNGMKVGFLGFSDVGPNKIQASENTSGILLADDPRMPEIVRTASFKVDILAVSFNFGEQYEAKHNDRQEYLAHLAIDSGAKIVVGTHPHVIQDSELYHGGFIAYSLGNFIFDQNFSTDTMKGQMLEITAGKNGVENVTQKVFSINKFFQPDKIISKNIKKIKDRVVPPVTEAPSLSGVPISLTRIFSKSNTKAKQVAITIDDAWDISYLKKALDILNAKKDRATFFPVGDVINSDPKLWQKILDGGNELGNHTLSHKWLSDLDDVQTDTEIVGWQNTLDSTLGYHYNTRWLRLPGITGAPSEKDNSTSRKIIDKYKLDIALWNIDTETGIYKQKGLNVAPSEVAKYVLDKVKSGDIIALRFTKPDIDALPLIIEGLHKKGLELVTLSEMISPAPETLITKAD